ncbi:hypothetical protein [Bacillus sp. BP-3]|uniref:hypothetical protein n=1 Tax=Bacillus sp. BP-3 TaxID=3022773 RepID=UPI00232B0B87|nr:hypothetical protein [Bacillus sp. BP-3]MDC2863999.1 hypothetical protein [Bacillus sp. BP-3]
MNVQEVIRRLNSGISLVELAEKINVCESQLRNALEGLEYSLKEGEWNYVGGKIGPLMQNKNKSIFEFVSKKEEVNFTPEQILILKKIADHHIEAEKIQKLKTEISTEINKLPKGEEIREKIVINNEILKRLNAFSDKLELRQMDIISLALSDLLGKYEIDNVK